MNTRKEIMDQCPEKFEGVLIDFIDEIEWEVNEAKKTLDGINGINDLHRVKDCWELLDKISKALY